MAPVEMIGEYKLYFDSGLCIVLKNVCYSANMARNIISFNAYILMVLILNLIMDQFSFIRIVCFISKLVLIKAYSKPPYH